MKKIISVLIVIMVFVSAVSFAETKSEKMNVIIRDLIGAINSVGIPTEMSYDEYYDIMEIKQTPNISALEIANEEIDRKNEFFDSIFEVQEAIAQIIKTKSPETTVFFTVVSNDNITIRAFVNGKDITSMLYINDLL